MHGLAYAYTRAVSLMLAGQGKNVADKERLPSCVRVCGCERVFEPIVWSSRLLSSLSLVLLSLLYCGPMLWALCSMSYALVYICLIDCQTINKVI